MERQKYLFIIAFMCVVSYSFGQNNRTIYHAYTQGNMQRWKTAMDSIETEPNLSTSDRAALVNYQYGYIAYSISQKEKSIAEKYLQKAEDNLEILSKEKEFASTVFTYRAAFVGFKIGLAQYKAPFIGMDSWEFVEKAIELDSTNALAFFQLANITYYTPAIFGGSKYKALKYFKKAIELIEKQPEAIRYNWNYLSFITTLIEIYAELKNYTQAIYYCEKALSVEPNFQWVKDELYPEILKNSTNE